MSKKFKTVKAAILGMIVMIAVAILFVPRNKYQTSINNVITVKNGVADSGNFTTVLEVKKTGKYYIIADWQKGTGSELEAPDFVSGLVITDENGKRVFATSASAIHIESALLELEAGKYTLSFQAFTSRNALIDFSTENMDKFDPYGVPDDDLFKDGTWDMHYNVKFDPDYSTFYLIAVLTGLVDGLLLVVIVVILSQNQNAPAIKYDERQIACQGKAYKYAFFSMIIYYAIITMVAMASDLFTSMRIPFALDFLVLVGVLIGIVVFAIIAIMKDAYFSLNENRTFIIIIFGVTSLINIAIGIVHIVSGDHIEDGVINIANSGNLLSGIAMLAVLVSLLIKKLLEEKED